jgi:hypothetical protein
MCANLANQLRLCSETVSERSGQTEQHPSGTEQLSWTGSVGSTARGGTGGTGWNHRTLWCAVSRYANVKVFCGDVRFIKCSKANTIHVFTAVTTKYTPCVQFRPRLKPLHVRKQAYLTRKSGTEPLCQYSVLDRIRA